MVAHTEPVRSWGHKPCGESSSPTTTCVSAGGGAAPRPPGTGRGEPEVQTLRNSALELAYGRRHFSAGVADRRVPNEQASSHAAASAAGTFALAPCFQGNYRGGTGGSIREAVFSRMKDDLGTAGQ